MNVRTTIGSATASPAPTARHRFPVACLLLVACAITVLVLPSRTRAQGWLDNLDDAEGPGIRVGDFELHPGVGVEVGWDSNVFYTARDQPDGVEPTSSALLRVTPHLILSTLTDERRGDGAQRGTPPPVEFRTGISASYLEYFEETAPDNLGLGADLHLTILPERPFSVRVDGGYRRGVQPFTEFGAADNNFARNSGDAGAALVFSTPGGALQGSVGYRLDFDLFEGQSFNYTNNVRHLPGAQFAWRFLPQSALIYDFSYQYTDFFNTAESPEGASRLIDNSVLRTRAGFNGYITRTISLTGMVGYGAVFFGGDAIYPEQDTVIGELELRWDTAPGTSIGLGYDRDLQVSYIGGFQRVDRGNLSVRTLIAGRFLISLTGSVAGLDFGPIVGPDGVGLGVDEASDRSDIRLIASLFAEYRILDWLGVNASIRYSSTITDFAFARELSEPLPVVDPAEFQKVQLWLGVRAFY